MSVGGGFKLETTRVSAAADQLAEVGLSRDEAPFFRWLLVKAKGALPNRAVLIDAADCTDLANRFFGVEGNAGMPFFSPFDGRGHSGWKAGGAGGTTNWAVQTIYTQFGRLNQIERQMYEQAVRIEPTTGQGELVKWQITPLPTAAYLSGLNGLMKERRVPVLELAIWRYRNDTFLPAEADGASLCRRLITELHLLRAELDCVFADGGAYSDACLDGTPPNPSPAP